VERIYEEVAFLALHLGWSYEALMQMDHFERRKWVDKVIKLRGADGEVTYEY